MDPEIVKHYSSGVEIDRLASGPRSWVEFARTKELLERLLPPAPARVLDVGGGPGLYAEWLAGATYDVTLVDPVPLHVEAASARSASAERPFAVRLGEARGLSEADGFVDAVLLLGPLYHLTDRSDRVRALAEARRVLAADGVVAAAAISRFASLLDGMTQGFLRDPEFRAIVERDLGTGQHRNPTGRPEYFTTAYVHHPNELRAELSDAGLEPGGVYAIEGPGWLAAEGGDDPEVREAILRAVRAIELEPALLGASAHLLAVGRRAP